MQALQFLILTAARVGEVLGATWDEINLADKVWTIPAARMKANKEHRVPLERLPPSTCCATPTPKPAIRTCSSASMQATLEPPCHGARLGADQVGCHRARFPIQFVLRLRARAHGACQPCHRTEPCPCRRRCGRAGVPARRHVRQAPQAHGRMGVRSAPARQSKRRNGWCRCVRCQRMWTRHERKKTSRRTARTGSGVAKICNCLAPRTTFLRAWNAWSLIGKTVCR